MKIVLSLGLSVMLVGCGKPAAPAPESTPSSTFKVTVPVDTNGATQPITMSEPDISATLTRLTQTLRRFAAENRRVPKSLDELVSAGYLPELPTPPGGKRFVFDEELRVSVK